LRDLIGRKITAVEIANIRVGGCITGVGRNGVPDVGGKAILRNAAAVFQCFGVEVLRLGQSLIGGKLIKPRSLGVISIGHQTAEVVGAVCVVLVGGELEPFLGRVEITRHAAAEEIASSGEPTGQRVALLSGLAIQFDGLAWSARGHGSVFVKVSERNLGRSESEVGGTTEVINPQRIVSRSANAGNGVHSAIVKSFRRNA